MLQKLYEYIKNTTFIKFCVVGTMNTLIDVGILQLLLWSTGVDPHTSPFLFLFVFIAFFCAMLNGFVLNKLWTFKMRARKNTTRQFIKFLISNLIGLAIAMVLMYFFVQVFHIGTIVASLMKSAIVLIWNFFASKHWTFRERRLDQIPHQGEGEDVQVSIIVPAYNEQDRIESTVAAIVEYVRRHHISFELLVVDDGSRDRTRQKVQQFIHLQHLEDRACVVALPRNEGKGAAVRAGVMRAVGKFILFTDADNSTPIEELGNFLTAIEDQDILIGSRYLKTSNVQKKQPWYRILISRMANMVIQAFLIDGIKDTQCGFKMLRYQAAKDIFSRMRIDGFGFDMELLALAEVLGYRIKELPVAWFDSPLSRVRPVKAAIRTLGDLVTIKLNIWTGKYHVTEHKIKAG